ncbi:NUDIX hydrolase [Salinarimonas chemoclinalis]|uniref:NUDIX hydrolase n=1 Tax=Salinarimonas chemoclinalis TaxID=3241599 RepID=UPI0035569893
MTDDRLAPSRPILAASVAVVRDGRVLLAARGEEPMRGRFTLPGGLVEPGETLAEAALRELSEEVGVTATMIGPIRPVEIILRDEAGRVASHFVVQAHAARWRAGEGKTGPEALAVVWADAADAERLPTTPGLPDIVRAAIAMAEGAR